MPSSKSYVALDDNQGRAEVSDVLSMVNVILQSTAAMIQSINTKVEFEHLLATAEAKRVLNSIMTSSTMLVSLEDASGVPFSDGTGGTFHVFI